MKSIPFRALLMSSVLGVLVVVGAEARAEQAPKPSARQITVYRKPTCQCCSRWADHVRKAGFEVAIKDVADLGEIRAKYGVPAALQSCHTAVVDGYVVEGHVPVDVIERLLRERPAIVGIAVPGMPMGSPGMEGDRTEHYNVLAFDKQGHTTVFAKK